MTTKQINLMDKKPVNQIEKGTIVKKSGDMFIVAKISEAQFTSVVDDALFGPRYNQSHHGRTVDDASFIPRYNQSHHGRTYVTLSSPRNELAKRNPSDAKYVLISLTTGLKFYPEFLTLPELLMRMTKAGFEIVNNIEIKELA